MIHPGTFFDARLGARPNRLLSSLVHAEIAGMPIRAASSRIQDLPSGVAAQ